MRKNHSKIVWIKLVYLTYLYIWCTVTLISNSHLCIWIFRFSELVDRICFSDIVWSYCL